MIPVHIIGAAIIIAAQTHPVRITTYGINDQYTGRRHAASWHQQTPKGAPDIVDYNYLGAASNEYPFGTRLLVEIKTQCNGEPIETEGRKVEVIVVDRLAGWVEDYVDLWPAAAKVVGLGYMDCAIGQVSVISQVVDIDK